MAACEQHVIVGEETHMQPRERGIGLRRQQLRLAQRRSQCVAETARKARELPRLVGIGMFDDQVAERRTFEQRRDDRGDAVLRIQPASGRRARRSFCPREDDVAQGQRLRERVALRAEELDEAGVALGAGPTGVPELRCAFAEFGGQFRFEAGAAITQQAVGAFEFHAQ
jgi:hypothetical protein